MAASVDETQVFYYDLIAAEHLTGVVLGNLSHIVSTNNNKTEGENAGYKGLH